MTVYTNAKTSGIGLAGSGVDFIADFSLSAGVASATEQIIKQYTLPPGLLGLAAWFKLNVLWAKTGTTDTSTVRMRLGTTGTVADTSVWTASLAAANRTGPTSSAFFASSSTQLRLLTAAFATGFEAGAFSANPYPNNITVSDMLSNSLIMSLTQTPSGATDTPQIAHVILTTY